jgi:hypothetical protein
MVMEISSLRMNALVDAEKAKIGAEKVVRVARRVINPMMGSA